jgi:hypothetical protein
MASSGGGFHTWWRRLYGSEDDLDNAHLMRLAGQFSRRVRAFAISHGIPVVDCALGERKHKIAEEYLITHPMITVGVFMILVSRAPAPVWEVEGKARHLRRKKPRPYVNHYSFHILDSEWGHLTVKICGHPPFPAQILLNGHEYVAYQATKVGIDFTKEGTVSARTLCSAAARRSPRLEG